MIEGEIREIPVTLRRPVPVAVRLGRLWGGCDCVSVHTPKRAFSADEEVIFTVRFDTRGMREKEKYRISVEVREPEKLLLETEIDLSVKRASAKLALNRNDFALGMVRGHGEAEVVLYNLTRSAVTLSTPEDAAGPGAEISFPAGATVPAGRSVPVRLRFTPPPDAVGPVSGRVALATTVPEHARMEIPFSGIAAPRPPSVASPSVASVESPK